MKSVDGHINNVIEVQPANFEDDEDYDNDDYFVIVPNARSHNSNYKIMIVNYTQPASWVAIKGSWDNWKDQIALKKVKNNQNNYSFYVTLKISPGNYQFKFIVDGAWTCSPAYPKVKVNKEIENNVLNIPSYFTLTTSKPKSLEEKAYLSWQRKEGIWAHGGSIHHTLQGHSMNVICDKVYIFGGVANAEFTNALYIYNPRTSEFSIIEDQAGDIPEPRAFHQYNF